LPLVAEPLAPTNFLCGDVRAPAPAVRYGTSAHLRLWAGAPISEELVRRFGPRSVVSLRLTGPRLDGRLFLLDKPNVTVDDLVLGEILAGIVAARLDHYYLLQRLRQAAATEERIRLARDLHDGVLQSFTGVALRLETARRLLNQDADAALRALEEVQRLIASEQRDLRFFIQELKPVLPGSVPLAGADGLAQRLGELVDRMEREWDLQVELHAHPFREPVPDSLAREIYHIVREAVVNAVRHGKATHVRVDLGVNGSGAIAVSVGDNGRGFPFHGQHSGDALAQMNLGPRTLRERVAAMKGSLIVESTTTGAALKRSSSRRSLRPSSAQTCSTACIIAGGPHRKAVASA
jgi:signal transduction histidine kinase